MYDYEDWRSLSRRLALKVPLPPRVRSSRTLFAACAILLTVVGVLIWLDYWK